MLAPDIALQILEGHKVVRVEKGLLVLELPSKEGRAREQQGEMQIPYDVCLWCTQASAAPWLVATGLPTGG
jgi:NADH dehydrogenase FAD-containing subunit